MNAGAVAQAFALDYLYCDHLPDPTAAADDYLEARLASPEPSSDRELA